MLRQIPRTKMVCTIGPATESPEMIGALIDAGMNVARLNFSHGDHAEHGNRINLIRDVSREKKVFVALLQDLQGPKIRTGKLKGGALEISKNQTVVLHYGSEQIGDEIPIDYAHLSHDIAVGARILLDDGLLGMKVTAIRGTDVECVVTIGGILKSRKGVNFPDSLLSIPATTEKDIRNLFFGVSQKVDYVALSFVQHAEDIIKLRAMIKNFGAEIPIIAKIEMKRAIENLDSICAAADAIMVARGDLGVECGFANVASLQKRIIKAASVAGKPVIVATQMLDSMQERCTPTKAEVLDVANAVYDNADATMLSGETASGKYPILAAQTMRDITSRVDLQMASRFESVDELRAGTDAVQDIVAHTAAELAIQCKAAAIVCLTMSGTIARAIASYHPCVPIFAIGPRMDVLRQLILIRNIHPVLNSEYIDTEKALPTIGKILASNNLVKLDDVVIITAGVPMGEVRSSNLVKLYLITKEDFK